MSSISRREFLKFAVVSAGAATLLPTKTALAKSNSIDASNHIGMLYDTTKCVGCNACSNACRDWNDTTPELDPSGRYDAPMELSADSWTLIQLYQDGDEGSFVKRQCMHCIDPGCVSGCPVHALEKTDYGAVTYDASRCIGCRYCMYACPFHVPRFEWDETIPLVTKCTLCVDRLSVGKGTACAEICPTGALIWGKRGDLLQEAKNRIAENPEKYEDYIYGENDAGGTSVLYLTHVPFEKLGFENLGTEPVGKLSEDTSEVIVPAILFGGPLVLAMIRQISKNEGWEESWPF